MKKNKNPIREEKMTLQRHDYRVWIIMSVILLATIALRIRLLDVPLERDEGEYAYAGQLMLEGVPPYTLAYNMKMPGIYAAYALIIGIFGQTHSAVRFGLLLVNSATIILVFFLAKRFYGQSGGIIAAASFALLSIGQCLLGIYANAEHFLIFFALGGILSLIYAAESGKMRIFFLSGLLFGIAFTMKQHAIGFIIFGIAYLIITRSKKSQTAVSGILPEIAFFVGGVILPFALVCLIFFSLGIFDKFWFWVFKYASEYVSSLPFAEGLRLFRLEIRFVTRPSILLWIIAGIGATALTWDREKRSSHLFAVGFFAFSFLSICPGLYFREHYFILTLPAISLLICACIDSMGRVIPDIGFLNLRKTLPLIVFFAVFLHSISRQYDYLFRMNPLEVSRITYGNNPFPEALEIAKYIKRNTSKKDTVWVVGSEPEIFFYSHRRSATGYIYIYPLMEDQKYAPEMQKELVREVESSGPKYIVFVNIPKSWMTSNNREQFILTWNQNYCLKYYTRSGIVDMLSPMNIRYLWEKESADYTPKSSFWLSVYRRNG